MEPTTVPLIERGDFHVRDIILSSTFCFVLFCLAHACDFENFSAVATGANFFVYSSEDIGLVRLSSIPLIPSKNSLYDLLIPLYLRYQDRITVADTLLSYD